MCVWGGGGGPGIIVNCLDAGGAVHHGNSVRLLIKSTGDIGDPPIKGPNM